MRDILYPLAMLLWLMLGGALFPCCVKIFARTQRRFPFCMSFTYIMGSLTIQVIIVYLPWVAHAVGDGSCADGGPWWQHLTYTIFLAMSTPTLSGMVFVDKGEEGKDVYTFQRLSCVCSAGLADYASLIYVYSVTVLATADQYLDVNTAVLAKSCGYDWWPAMISCYALSLVMQAMGVLVVYCCFSPDAEKTPQPGGILAVGTLAGINPEIMGRVDDDKGLALAMAAGSFLRFLTECLPQIGFAFDFAKHQDLPDSDLIQVYGSITLSFVIGANSFVSSIRTVRRA